MTLEEMKARIQRMISVPFREVLTLTKDRLTLLRGRKVKMNNFLQTLVVNFHAVKNIRKKLILMIMTDIKEL